MFMSLIIVLVTYVFLKLNGFFSIKIYILTCVYVNTYGFNTT